MSILKKIVWGISFVLVTKISLAQSGIINSVSVPPQSIIVNDSTNFLRINNITIKGNKKTKDYIILREAQLTKGDSIVTKKLYSIIEQARQNVYNTTLFNEVKINTIAIDAFTIDIEIDVKERWYIFPTPQFKIVDRSFNEWIKTYNADLQRVIYGVKFAHYNISGRRDQLRFYLLNGYIRGVAISYTAPYSNKALTEGFSIGLNYAEGREINYKTFYSNKLAFFSAKKEGDNINSFVSKSVGISATYRLRKGIFNSHNFGAAFTYLKVSDSVHLKYNPNYLGVEKSSITYPEFSYSYLHTNVNNVAYPLKGNSGYVSILKKGLGFTGKVSMLNLEAGYNKFIDLGSNWYLSNGVAASIKLPFKQPYVNQRGLGYGSSFLRGLELYAIDGVAFALNKATLKKKIASFKLKLPIKIPFLFKKNETIPFTFFAKTFSDVGFCYSKYEATNLSNRLLYTGGFGFDMLTFYDFNVKFEYSFNQLNERGFFFRVQSGF